MFNVIMSIMFAASASAFYFEKDNVYLTVLCFIFSFLFSAGYFDVNKKHKKSVK